MCANDRCRLRELPAAAEETRCKWREQPAHDDVAISKSCCLLPQPSTHSMENQDDVAASVTEGSAAERLNMEV